jgi:hypothetical protein
MTFDVTPEVSVDAKLFKNVVSAGGGQVQTSTTPAGNSKWRGEPIYMTSWSTYKGIQRQLAQEARGSKIYSPELVLRGVLRQWNV